MTSWIWSSRSCCSGTASAGEEVPVKKAASASAVARVMNVLMVGSRCLVDVAIAAGTIRAYASKLRTEDQRKYGAAIHLLFTSNTMRESPNMLVRSEIGRLPGAILRRVLRLWTAILLL